MTIQFNTDNNINGTENLREPFIALLTDELSRFSDQITRLEVHLTDQDGNKDGLNDKRCVLEARLEGMQPIAVTKDASTHEKAIQGAIDKMKNLLTTKLDRKQTW